MSDLLSRRLAQLGEPANLSLLGECLHGIERECLRVTRDGQLALTPHPQALGSALTHAQITTDYSESLLEFITGTAKDPAATLAELDSIHRFAYDKLNGELLWSTSMPCQLPNEETIPIARYGSSNIGRLKYVYRKGLALRYGKTMQCIAGIHYNFSLPEKLWQLQQQSEGTRQWPSLTQTQPINAGAFHGPGSRRPARIQTKRYGQAGKHHTERQAGFHQQQRTFAGTRLEHARQQQIEQAQAEGAERGGKLDMPHQCDLQTEADQWRAEQRGGIDVVATP